MSAAQDDPQQDDARSNGTAVEPQMDMSSDAAAETGIDFDPLEESIALEMQKEFGQASDAPAEEPVAAPAERSSRLLDMQRKREMCIEMEEQARQGTALIGSLQKQIGILGGYLEKAEGDLKRLEKVEANANKLRIASDGICRKNHEMKATIEEQKKRIALLEAKTSALRETNETARTNLARLLEEKRIATVDLSAAQSEIARLENDKTSMSEKLEVIGSEVGDLVANLDKSREREKAAIAESRKKDEDLSRVSDELEELRTLKKQNAIDLEELKNRNSVLESKAAEQKSRLDELAFEMESGRKELEEVIRLKQQRILELEARGEEYAQSRREVSEDDTPPMAFDPAKERKKAVPEQPSRGAKAAAKQPAKASSKS